MNQPIHSRSNHSWIKWWYKQKKIIPKFDYFNPDPQLLSDSVNLLKTLVNINSPTPYTKGVEAVLRTVAEELSPLGFKIKLIPNPLNTPEKQESADLVLCERKVTEQPFINLVSHGDTVLDLERTGPFCIDGNHATGSGVIDNKGGLVVLLQGLKLYLKRNPHSRQSFRVIICPNEEGGSVGFHSMFRKWGEECSIALGFEPALDNGSIIHSRRGNRWYNVHIRGEEAHTGRCQGEEINAAYEFAKKASALSRLNSQRYGLTTQISRVEGGSDRYNIVCGEIRFQLDVRFPDFKARQWIEKRIRQILDTSYTRSLKDNVPTQTQFHLVDDCPPFCLTRKSKALIKTYLKEIQKIEGFQVAAERAGGAGDVNHMSTQETVIIDGLGPIGGRMHTLNEFIYLPSLASRALAFSNFLEHVN